MRLRVPRVRGWLLDAHRSEQGQVLILFVAMFTVILAMAAFSIDQGLWFGRRRVAQNAADAAARGGVIALMGKVTATGVVPVALEPCGQAAQTAMQNRVPMINTAICHLPVAPDCVKSQVQQSTGALFARAFGVTGIDVGAHATACVGAIRTLRLTDPEAVPLALRNDDTATNSCFSGGNLHLGAECVIFGSTDEQSGAAKHPRLRYSKPTTAPCYGGDPRSDAAILKTQMASGITFNCTINTGGCSGRGNPNTGCVGARRVAAKDASAFEAMQARLLQESSCGSPFHAAFGYGDGHPPQNAGGPPPFGGDPPATVYVQNGCSGDKRVAIMPITSGAMSDSLMQRPVEGFAVVYITGCFKDTDQPITERDQEQQLNDCPGSGVGGDEDEECEGEDEHACADKFSNHSEIRGVPIQTFRIEGATGEIGPTVNPNAPLTIQTVQ